MRKDVRKGAEGKGQKWEDVGGKDMARDTEIFFFFL